MNADIQQIQIGQRFSFEVFPAAILGNTFKDVVLDAHLSPDGARAFGCDIHSLHANVYRTLPNTVPNDPSKYNYLRVRHANGAFSIIGEPYIRPDSIVLSTHGVLQLRFDNVTQMDQTRILNALSANGFTPSSNLLQQM